MNTAAQLEAQLSGAIEPSERLELLHRLFHLVHPENPARARLLAETAVEVAEISTPAHQARALKDLGECLYDLGELAAARDCLLQALSVGQEAFDGKNLAEIQYRLGKIYQHQGEFPQALEQYISALDLARHAEAKRLQADTLEGIAALQQTIGNYPEAAKFALRSLVIRRESGNPGDQVSSLGHLGRLYLEMGDYQGAVALHQENLELVRQLGDQAAEAEALHHLGIAHSHLGYHNHSSQYQEAALELAQALDLRQLQADILEQLGRNRAALGNAEQSIELFYRARTIFQDLGNRASETRTLVQMGLTLQQLGQSDGALDTLYQALISSEDLGLRRTRLEALHALVKVHELNGDISQSLRHLKIALELERTLFQEQQSQQTAALLASFGFERIRQQAATIQQHNIELDKLNHELEAVNENLRETNTEKTKLLEKLSRQADELERLARQDSLTRLFNRRYLEENLSREFAASRRYRYPLSIALVDIDHFKKINDTFSHQVGDEVLRIVGNILESGCRGTDFAARYGGEEFALVLPQTDLSGAIAACERVRGKIEEYSWDHIQPGLHVTVSIGVSNNPHLVDHEKLLGEADERLYAAKRGGRNQVVSS